MLKESPSLGDIATADGTVEIINPDLLYSSLQGAMDVGCRSACVHPAVTALLGFADASSYLRTYRRIWNCVSNFIACGSDVDGGPLPFRTHPGLEVCQSDTLSAACELSDLIRWAVTRLLQATGSPSAKSVVSHIKHFVASGVLPQVVSFAKVMCSTVKKRPHPGAVQVDELHTRDALRVHLVHKFLHYVTGISDTSLEYMVDIMIAHSIAAGLHLAEVYEVRLYNFISFGASKLSFCDDLLHVSRSSRMFFDHFKFATPQLLFPSPMSVLTASLLRHFGAKLKFKQNESIGSQLFGISKTAYSKYSALVSKRMHLHFGPDTYHRLCRRTYASILSALGQTDDHISGMLRHSDNSDSAVDSYVVVLPPDDLEFMRNHRDWFLYFVDSNVFAVPAPARKHGKRVCISAAH
jgi:hypothetical protein